MVWGNCCATQKKRCRSDCGAVVIIPNVLSYLVPREDEGGWLKLGYPRQYSEFHDIGREGNDYDAGKSDESTPSMVSKDHNIVVAGWYMTRERRRM